MSALQHRQFGAGLFVGFLADGVLFEQGALAVYTVFGQFELRFVARQLGQQRFVVDFGQQFPLADVEPSWKLIETILPEVSNERSTSSSGSRLPTEVMPSVRVCGRTTSPLTFRTLFFRGMLISAGSAADELPR